MIHMLGDPAAPGPTQSAEQGLKTEHDGFDSQKPC